jgi:hypothetical protein
LPKSINPSLDDVDGDTLRGQLLLLTVHRHCLCQTARPLSPQYCSVLCSPSPGFWKLLLAAAERMLSVLAGCSAVRQTAGNACSSLMPAGLKLKLIYDLQLVGQSVLVSGAHLRRAKNFSFSLKFSLDSCLFFVAPSLTRGRVCNLVLFLVLASAVLLGSESRGTQGHISLSQFLRLAQPRGPGSRTYIPQEQGGPDIPPGTGFIPPPHGSDHSVS